MKFKVLRKTLQNVKRKLKKTCIKKIVEKVTEKATGDRLYYITHTWGKFFLAFIFQKVAFIFQKFAKCPEKLHL